MAKQIACIVEGQGDVEAVPIVVRRIASEIVPDVETRVATAIRLPKSKLVKPGELEKAVEFAIRKTSGHGGVLIVLDADDDCPAQTGPKLLGRAVGVRAHVSVSAIIAKREFESWFIAAAESIAGHVGLKVVLEVPPEPEEIRGAKEWLTERMEGSRSYSPTLDQPALARTFDMQLALRAGSFEKFHREVKRLLLEVPDID